jgi:hypothetical protein
MKPPTLEDIAKLPRDLHLGTNPGAMKSAGT